MRRGELVRLLGASPGRESTAILIPVQVALFLLITVFLMNWFVQMQRRSRRSWQAIVARMSGECRAACKATVSGQAEALAAIWIRTPRAAFRDAGVLMEMAEYAELNSSTEDVERMQPVRSAALRMRVAATGAIIRRTSLR